MYTFSQSRRSFLGTISALAISMLGNSKMKKDKWGIILNTVKHEMQADWRATLEKVAEMGYSYLEGGYSGDSAIVYRKFIDGLGLRAIAGGSSIRNIEVNIDRFILEAEQLGYEYICCYWPWLTDGKNLSKEECLVAADSLNKLGKRFKEEGFAFTWHNHDKEFAEVEGKLAFDWLMENTDPEYVNAQMDVYWVVKGGADPVNLIQTYPGRFPLLHMKDMHDDVEQSIACVGTGMVDFQKIKSAFSTAGVKYSTVEHERIEEGKGLACAQTSIDHLFTLT